MYTWLVYTACAAVLVVTCEVQSLSLTAWGPGPAVVGLGLALFSTILGHSIFSWSLKFFSPAFVSASKLSEPVMAAALAALLFGEIPTPWQVAGGALIVGGVAWYSKLESGSQSA